MRYTHAKCVISIPHSTLGKTYIVGIFFGASGIDGLKAPGWTATTDRSRALVVAESVATALAGIVCGAQVEPVGYYEADE